MVLVNGLTTSYGHYGFINPALPLILTVLLAIFCYFTLNLYDESLFNKIRPYYIIPCTLPLMAGVETESLFYVVGLACYLLIALQIVYRIIKIESTTFNLVAGIIAGVICGIMIKVEFTLAILMALIFEHNSQFTDNKITNYNIPKAILIIVTLISLRIAFNYTPHVEHKEIFYLLAYAALPTFIYFKSRHNNFDFMLCYGAMLLAQIMPIVMKTGSINGLHGVNLSFASAFTIFTLMHTRVRYSKKTPFGKLKVVYDQDHDQLSLYNNNTYLGCRFQESNQNPELKQIAAEFNNGSYKIAVIGMGTKELVNYFNDQTHIDFYELNPQLENIVNEHFKVNSRHTNHNIIIGNVREKIQEAIDHSYDAIIINYYYSESQFNDLITYEAFKIYLNKLVSDGLIILCFKDINTIPLITRNCDELDLSLVIKEPQTKLPNIKDVLKKADNVGLIIGREKTNTNFWQLASRPFTKIIQKMINQIYILFKKNNFNSDMIWITAANKQSLSLQNLIAARWTRLASATYNIPLWTDKQAGYNEFQNSNEN